MPDMTISTFSLSRASRRSPKGMVTISSRAPMDWARARARSTSKPISWPLRLLEFIGGWLPDMPTLSTLKSTTRSSTGESEAARAPGATFEELRRRLRGGATIEAARSAVRDMCFSSFSMFCSFQ